MDFGLFVPCHRLDESVGERQVIEHALATVELADEAGFRVAWFPEHHLIQYIACPSPLMLAVKAAARTRRIRVGTAILVMPYYDPRRLAGEIGLADILTEGRLEVGVGRGAFDYEFNRFGVNEKIAAQRLREGMEIVEGLLTSEDFEYQGATWSLPPATAVPKPLQKPYPPIWVAGRSPDTIRWAIERGYHQLATPWREPFGRVEFLYNQFKQLVEECRPARRPKFALSRMTFVGATDGEALEAMRVVQTHHRIFTRLFRNQATVKGGFTVPEPVEDEYEPERLFANLVAGSPETCIEKLRMYEALGVDHYVMYAGFPTDHAATMRSIRLFAERVMPHFAAGGPAPAGARVSR
jgi:alkanesulfonate monooxygenase SsuD/methylene tetrahydromethanopterin reductase-like flavin-dependent oxidoreductase (luciferase family)